MGLTRKVSRRIVSAETVTRNTWCPIFGLGGHMSRKVWDRIYRWDLLRMIVGAYALFLQIEACVFGWLFLTKYLKAGDYMLVCWCSLGIIPGAMIFAFFLMFSAAEYPDATRGTQLEWLHEISVESLYKWNVPYFAIVLCRKIWDIVLRRSAQGKVL
jgi:hypothetical protein